MRQTLTAIVDAIIGFCWRITCRHEWKKNELATRQSIHTLVRNGMFVKGFCRKCGKQGWLMVK